MKIGELAREAGVTVDTVRYYERRGVLPVPARLDSGYRSYHRGALERLKLAKRLQALGFTLDEIIDALHEADRGMARCDDQRWRLEAVVTRLDEKIAELQRTRREVAGVLRDCDRGRCRFERSASPARRR